MVVFLGVGVGIFVEFLVGDVVGGAVLAGGEGVGVLGVGRGEKEDEEEEEACEADLGGGGSVLIKALKLFYKKILNINNFFYLRSGSWLDDCCFFGVGVVVRVIFFFFSIKNFKFIILTSV